jgi:predicted aspartyl protease
VRTQIRYSTDYDPPCPVLALRVAAPLEGSAVALVAVVDTGADVTLIPQPVAALLGLPAIAQARIAGVTGPAQTADLFAATIELAGRTVLAEVAAFGAEAIIGRDLLSRLVLRLDGPRGLLELAADQHAPDGKGRQRTRDGLHGGAQ